MNDLYREMSCDSSFLGSEGGEEAKLKMTMKREKKKKMNKLVGERKMKKTRPDIRPSVADGWAGAEMRVFPLFNSITDQPTDRPTNGRTKPLIELRVRN